MRTAGLNGLFFLSMTFLSALLCGCGSLKEITVADPSGSPVKGCHVYARQENMLWPNSSDLLVTDDRGIVRISRSGLVWIYAGKEGYFITSAALVGDIKTRITVYPLNDPDRADRAKGSSHYVSLDRDEIDRLKNQSHAENDLIRYMATTPVILVDQEME